jgi:hypothetical protein
MRAKHHVWTPEEDAILMTMAKKDITERQASEMIGLARESVRRRMDKIGAPKRAVARLTKWTPEMDAILRRYIHTEKREDIGARLGMSKAAVISRAKRIGLGGKTAPGTARPWDDEEITFMRENVSAMSMTQIGKELGRSISAVSRKLEALGIKPAVRVGPQFVVYHAPRKAKPVIEIPATARPWLTRLRGECKYPYGPRGAVMSCCAPEWMESGYCENHAALCGGYRRKAA